MLNFLILVSSSYDPFIFGDKASEDKRSCPYTGKSNQSINDSAHNRDISVEKPTYDVEPKDSDTAPNQCSHNGKRKGNLVNYVHSDDQYLSWFRL